MQNVSIQPSADTAIEAYPERANLYKITLDPMPTHLYHVRSSKHSVIEERVHLTAVENADVQLMSVVVYPRLAELLRAKNLTVAELERQIKERFGLGVNVKTLYRLTQAAPVQRADLEIAGATAAILGVGLDELFTVEARSDSSHRETVLRLLTPADSQRMAALMERQAHGLLSDQEWADLEMLVARYGQLLHERRVRDVALAQGWPLEQVRREMVDSLARAVDEWHTIEADLSQTSATGDHDPASEAR